MWYCIFCFGTVSSLTNYNSCGMLYHTITDRESWTMFMTLRQAHMRNSPPGCVTLLPKRWRVVSVAVHFTDARLTAPGLHDARGSQESPSWTLLSRWDLLKMPSYELYAWYKSYQSGLKCHLMICVWCTNLARVPITANLGPANRIIMQNLISGTS